MTNGNYQDYLNALTNQIAVKQNLNNPSWDLFILVCFVGLVLLFIFALNRDRLIVTILSTYVVLALMGALNIINRLENLTLPVYWSEIIIFLIVFILLNTLISRATSFSGGGLSGIFWAVILSVLQVGLLLSTLLSFLPKEIMQNFMPLTQRIFIGDWTKTLWFILPLASMIFMRRR